MRPLPTPDSPVISTVVLTEARRLVRSITFCIVWLLEIMSPWGDAVDIVELQQL